MFYSPMTEDNLTEWHCIYFCRYILEKNKRSLPTSGEVKHRWHGLFQSKTTENLFALRSTLFMIMLNVKANINHVFLSNFDYISCRKWKWKKWSHVNLCLLSVSHVDRSFRECIIAFYPMKNENTISSINRFNIS